MIQIKRNLILSLERRKKKGELITENVPIRLRINYAGSRLDIYTGYRIDIKKWNKEKEQVKNGAFNKLDQSSSSINSRIFELKVAIQDLFKEFESKDLIPTKDQIRLAANKLTGKGKTKKHIETPDEYSFFDVFDIFVKESSRLGSWSEATIEKFASVKNHLKSFNSNLEFEVFSEVGLIDYLIFLRKKKEMINVTIKKQLGLLKWFLKWSFEKKYHTNNTYQTFKPKIKISKKKIIFLTEDEKEKIIKYEIPSSKIYLDRVRDILLFTCYTGLRYSDVYNLKRTDIQSNYIDVTTIKTSDDLIIEFNKHSRRILKKYEDIPYKNNKALPVISNQKMNDYIKELGELAKIDTPIRITHYSGNERIDKVFPKYKLLSTHVGRRTFTCSALAIGIPVQVIMKWTGHSGYKSMEPYIDISDNTKKISMEKFNQL